MGKAWRAKIDIIGPYFEAEDLDKAMEIYTNNLKVSGNWMSRSKVRFMVEEIGVFEHRNNGTTHILRKLRR